MKGAATPLRQSAGRAGPRARAAATPDLGVRGDRSQVSGIILCPKHMNGLDRAISSGVPDYERHVTQKGGPRVPEVTYPLVGARTTPLRPSHLLPYRCTLQETDGLRTVSINFVNADGLRAFGLALNVWMRGERGWA